VIWLARFFAFLNVVILPMFEFKAVKYGEPCGHGWDSAHHEIEGRNGGRLFIRRLTSIVWPKILQGRFQLLMKERRNVPR